MRILLAGVPFGCENVGDEAILECAVQIFRETAPEAQLTASTRDPARTAQRLGIETCGLLGFDNDVSPEDTRSIINAHDCFVWCGATGLSDYPQVTTGLMRTAQELGKKTVLWGVGMNDELNPAFYRVGPGLRRSLLKALGLPLLGMVNTIGLEEKRRDTAARSRIAACLNAADLVVVRDAQSRKELQQSGVTRDIIVGADSAILLEPANLSEMDFPPGILEFLRTDSTKIGLCISAQRAIAAEGELIDCLERIIADTDGYIFGIPMNPLTDSAIMARLAGKLSRRDRMLVMTGEYNPAEILAVAAEMDVIVSSRLHLLILARIVGTPMVGVGRGSKVNTFLSHMNLSAVATVDSLDFSPVHQEVLRQLKEAESFRATCDAATARDMETLGAARAALAPLIAN